MVYMAKEEYYTSKLPGRCAFFGAFPVKRGEGDRQALRAAEGQLEGNILGIFPEGTRSVRDDGKGARGYGNDCLAFGRSRRSCRHLGQRKDIQKVPFAGPISYGKPMLLKPKGKKVTPRRIVDQATEQVMRNRGGAAARISRRLWPEITCTGQTKRVYRDCWITIDLPGVAQPAR